MILLSNCELVQLAVSFIIRRQFRHELKLGWISAVMHKFIDKYDEFKQLIFLPKLLQKLRNANSKYNNDAYILKCRIWKKDP